MARVKGPNGTVIDIPASLASGLVGDGTRGYEYVEDKPQADSKSTPKPKPKPKSRKS